MARELKPRSLGVGVARCRPLPRALQAMTRQSARRSVMDFCSALQKRTHRPGSAKFLLRHRKTDSQSVGFSLNGTPCALQHYMSLIPKTKEVMRVGLGF